MFNNVIYKTNTNKKTFSRIYGMLYVFLIISLITVIFTLTHTDLITNIILKKKNLPFLLIISDDDGPMMTEAVLYNAKTHRLALIDIPYEAGDLLPDLKRSDRYSVFYQQGDKARYQSSIEKLLGLKFLFTLDLHVRQLVQLVDLLEGISLYFFAPIKRVNPVSQRHYIYNAGKQQLDGDQSRDFLYANVGTLDYSEYLGKSEDTSQNSNNLQKGRILRQKNLHYARELLLGIVTALQKYSSERENYINLIYSYFQTDLNKRSFRKFLLYLSEIDAKSAELIFQDYLGKERMVQDKKINFPVYNGQVIRSQVMRISRQLHTLDEIVTEQYPVRVEVLNGTNVVGLAYRTGVLYSQEEGFDIINIGNADRSDYDKTVVINLHSNNVNDLRRVAKLIGAENVILQPLLGGEQAEAEVRVILGRDFDGNRVLK